MLPKLLSQEKKDKRVEISVASVKLVQKGRNVLSRITTMDKRKVSM
jgi:hypothetical protein